MKNQLLSALAASAAALGFAASTLATPLVSQSHPLNSELSKIGKAVTYPVKKAAGNGSKDVNHGGKTVEYPVRKTGVNASKTGHKTVHAVLPKKS